VIESLHDAWIFILGAEIHRCGGIDGIVVPKPWSLSLAWLDVTKCEVECAIIAADCGPAACDGLFAAIEMAKLELGIVTARPLSEVSVVRVCRIMQMSHVLWCVLILLEYVSQLFNGVAAIEAELAFEASAIEFKFSEPGITLWAYSGESAWSEWSDFVVVAYCEAPVIGMCPMTCVCDGMKAFRGLFFYLRTAICVEDEYPSVGPVFIPVNVLKSSNGGSFLSFGRGCVEWE